MADRPLLFSAPMVRALLAGTKTQTRRVIKGVPMFTPEYDLQWRPHVLHPGGAMPGKWSWSEGPSCARIEPALNPQENIWQFMRDSGLSNCIFTDYDDTVAHCCKAWSKLVEQPRTSCPSDCVNGLMRSDQCRLVLNRHHSSADADMAHATLLVPPDELCLYLDGSNAVHSEKVIFYQLAKPIV